MIIGNAISIGSYQIGGTPNSNTYFSYPAEIPFTFQIWREGDIVGTGYNTDFDWEDNNLLGSKAYYVDPVSGDDGAAGTELAPLKTAKIAAEKIDRDIVYLKPGIYSYADGLQGTNLSGVARPLKITTYGGAGRAILTTKQLRVSVTLRYLL
jgi:hypothetical protein